MSYHALCFLFSICISKFFPKRITRFKSVKKFQIILCLFRYYFQIEHPEKPTRRGHVPLFDKYLFSCVHGHSGGRLHVQGYNTAML